MERNSQLLASLYKRLSEAISALDSGSLLFASSLIVMSLTRTSRLPFLLAPVEGCQQNCPESLDETRELTELEVQLKVLLVQALEVHQSIGGALFFGQCCDSDVGEDDCCGLENSWCSLVGLVSGMSACTPTRDIFQNPLEVKVVNQLTSALLVCRVMAGGNLTFTHLLWPSSNASALTCSPALGNTFVCIKAFIDSNTMCDSDSDVMERVISPLPTTLQDVKPENLVCLFQTPLDNTKTGCSITVTLQRCVVLGDDNMEEKRVQVVMERHWPNASAHCTVTTNCSDDDFYFSHQHSPQRNVDSKSFSLPTISSPPSLNTPRGGATLGPGIGSCAFRLPVTPETTRKEEPQHNTFPTNVGDDDDMIVEENKKEPDQLPFSSSPVSPLLSFSTLPEFCPPQSVASLSSEDLSPPDMDYSDQNKDNQEQDEEQELEEECLIRASPCLSPTLAVRVSPSMQEVVDQCVEETVQENIHKDVDTEQVVDEGAPLPVAVSRLQDSPSATSESLMDEHTRLQERQETQGSPQQEQIQEQFQENEQDKEQELHNISTLTSPHVSSSPARGHRQSSPHLVPLSSPPAATAKSHTPSPSPPPPPRVSGVIDNLLWAVLTLTSTTGTDGVDNHTGDMDSSVGSRSRSSSCNSLAELNVHVPDPSSAADS